VRFFAQSAVFGWAPEMKGVRVVAGPDPSGPNNRVVKISLQLPPCPQMQWGARGVFRPEHHLVPQRTGSIRPVEALVYGVSPWAAVIGMVVACTASRTSTGSTGPLGGRRRPPRAVGRPESAGPARASPPILRLACHTSPSRNIHNISTFQGLGQPVAKKKPRAQVAFASAMSHQDDRASWAAEHHVPTARLATVGIAGAGRWPGTRCLS